MPRSRSSVVVTPFIVVIDKQEKHPWTFQGIKSDADQQERPFVVRTVTRHLVTADYTVDGLEDLIRIERKSHEDLWNTLAPEDEYERFQRELDRMRDYRNALVVVEASWQRILTPPPLRKTKPKSIARKIQSLMLRFPHVQWITAFDRRFAECWSFQLLRKAWIHRQRELKAQSKSTQGVATPHAEQI